MAAEMLVSAEPITYNTRYAGVQPSQAAESSFAMSRDTAQSGWREVEHTADAAFEAWGPDLSSFLRAAGQGFIELLVDPATVRSRRSREIEVSEDDAETLLVSWLEEILVALELNRLAPTAVEVSGADEWSARGTLHGETLDEDRHEVRTVVKAITYHGLDVHREDGLLRARVIVDI